MTEPADPLDDFDRISFGAVGLTHRVFVGPGSGTPVVLLHELPNLSPQVARLARDMTAQGFRVWVPDLVGKAGRPFSRNILPETVEICIRKEFAALAGGGTRPVVGWIRALVRHVSAGAGGSSVGLIGMCFSGGFALGAATEPAVAAAVSCQPALPMTGVIPGFAGAPFAGGAIDLDLADATVLRERVAAGALAVQGYRFEGDAISPCARRLALDARLGDAFDGRCLPDEPSEPNVKSPGHHSVITVHLIDNVGEPTREARDRVLAFLQWRLRGGPPLVLPTAALRDCAMLGCARGRKPPAA